MSPKRPVAGRGARSGPRPLARREPATTPRAACPTRPSPISTAPASCGSCSRAALAVTSQFRRVLPHHRNPRRGLRRQRLGLRRAGRAPMDHRLHAGAGADRRLGRRSARRRLVLAGPAGNGASGRGWMAIERTVSVFLRLPARGMGHHRRALRGCGGQPRRPAIYWCRCAEIEIVDDWEVLGLRGTGSRSLVLNDVFVPAHRSVLLRDLYDGTTPGALVHPGLHVAASAARLAGAVLPAGRRLHSGPAGAATWSRPRYAAAFRAAPTRLAESEVVQQQLGEASAEIETAMLIMRARREETLALVDSGAAIPPEAVLRNRRDIAFAVWQVRRGWSGWSNSPAHAPSMIRIRCKACGADLVTISTHTVVSRHLGDGAVWQAAARACRRTAGEA